MRVFKADPGVTFANIRTATTGTGAYDDTANPNFTYIYTSNTSNQFRGMGRGVFLFDTSSIASGATVTSATLSIYGIGKTNGQGSPEIDVVTANPASNTALAAGDYDYNDFGTSPFASIAYASWSTTGYNDFSVGASAVTKAGITKLGTRVNWDTDNSYGGSWTSADITGYSCYTADQAGTTNDPKLVVVYTGSTAIKTVNDLAKASVKTVNDLAIASVKTWGDLA